MEGMAFENSLDGQEQTLDHPKSFEARQTVFRTGWQKSAFGEKKGR